MSLFWMLLITGGILQISLLCSTIYLHRALCHRALELHPLLANLMHLQVSLFTGIIPREWVAVHRKHHHFSDREGDPHSPHLLGVWRVLFGNYVLYENERKNSATILKYSPNYRPDWVDRIPGLRYGGLGGLTLFMLMFGWEWGLAAMLFHSLFYVLLNASVNSLAHMVGYRNWDNPATNLRFLAMVAGGEGLHNNHHAFPSAAKFSMRRMEVDPAWPVIRLLQGLRLARVRTVSMENPAPEWKTGVTSAYSSARERAAPRSSASRT